MTGSLKSWTICQTGSQPSATFRYRIRTWPSEELERGVKRLGLKGFQILTNVNGGELSVPELDPFLEKGPGT